MSLIGCLRCLPATLAGLQAPPSIAAAACAGTRTLTGLAQASALAAIGNQQLNGVAALMQRAISTGRCCSTSWPAAGAVSAAAQTNRLSSRSISTSCSCQSSTPKSSLRADLGSGSALGAVGAAAEAADSDIARRRQSLLGKSGRFYDTVTVVPYTAPAAQQQQAASSDSSSTSSGYQLLLHKYPIKTPAKQLLVLPTYSLALAIAAEWEWLPKGKPVPHSMPLMSLAATALDQPKERPKVIEHLLKYVHTDGACIRYEPGPLERRQQRVFDPLLQWCQQELGWQLFTSHSIFGTTQPDATVAAVEKYLEGLDRWHLAAAEQLITASKSVVIAAALLHGRISVSEAVAAARIEEDFQLEDWGMVEAGHDLDIADTNSRIGAPAVFTKLLALP